MFSNHNNKDIARRLVEEGFNKQDLHIVDDIVTTDALTHDTQTPIVVGKGPEGLKRSMQPYTTAFPDAKLTIEREVSEGDYVVQFVRTRGTQTGGFRGIAATNKKTDIAGIITSKFKDGKIVETWSLFDRLGLMQQLGVLPQPDLTETPELVAASR
jgi:steroid delta-isomerase-like uncharacterized protein